MNKTKEEILDAALNLFSQKGFSTVSIRDICSVVNIKESTVYYHFQNKEAILNEILKQFENHSESLIAKMSSAFPALMSDPQEIEKLLPKIMNEYIDGYLTDPFCNKVIRILSIDQLQNPKVHQLYSYWLFEKPLEIQQFVFSVFNNARIVSCDDPAFAAAASIRPRQWRSGPCPPGSSGLRKPFPPQPSRRPRPPRFHPPRFPAGPPAAR